MPAPPAPSPARGKHACGFTGSQAVDIDSPPKLKLTWEQCVTAAQKDELALVEGQEYELVSKQEDGRIIARGPATGKTGACQDWKLLLMLSCSALGLAFRTCGRAGVSDALTPAAGGGGARPRLASHGDGMKALRNLATDSL